MKTIEEFKLNRKRVLVRVDFNVPLNEKGEILDDFRIRMSLPTIEYLKEKGAKTILISHLGGEPKRDKRYSLKKIVLKLNDLIGQKVGFLRDCVGRGVQKRVKKMKSGEVVLLENLRFHKGEKKGDFSFARNLASLGEIFLNDAFSVCHRAHASVVGVPRHLPSGAGKLLKKEVNVLSRILKSPLRPYLVILGGIKVSSKIKPVFSFLEKADQIILGAMITQSILEAKGVTVGGLLPPKEVIEEAKEIDLTNPKLHFPMDIIVSLKDSKEEYLRETSLGEVRKEERIQDIGEGTRDLFSQVIKGAKTIVWAGPLGHIEIERFTEGTKFIADAILRNHLAFRVVGGGETCFILKKFGLRDRFDFVSTGGGAMLQYLSGKELPGLRALEKKS